MYISPQRHFSSTENCTLSQSCKCKSATLAEILLLGVACLVALMHGVMSASFWLHIPPIAKLSLRTCSATTSA